MVVLAPMFFADPAGAVVGRLCSSLFPNENVMWFKNKTVAGSCAVCVVSFLSILYPVPLVARVLLAFLCAIAEAIGGDFDNMLLAFCVISAWLSLA